MQPSGDSGAGRSESERRAPPACGRPDGSFLMQQLLSIWPQCHDKESLSDFSSAFVFQVCGMWRPTAQIAKYLDAPSETSAGQFGVISAHPPPPKKKCCGK